MITGTRVVGTVMLSLALAAAAVGASGCGGSREDTLTAQFVAFQDALKNKDGEKVWDLLAAPTREYFEHMAKAATVSKDPAAWAEFLQCSASEVKGMTAKKAVIAHMKFLDRKDPLNYFRVVRDATRVYDIVRQPAAAEAKMTVEEGKYNKIEFKYEDRVWKINIPGHQYFQGPKQNLN